ncbi:MAG: aminopeptidase, partial [Acidobacteriota bacterium]
AKSISWTTARRNATDRGVRIATLPGITPEILLRNFPADYELIRSRVNRFADQLDQGRTVQIRTSLGTHLVFSIAGREAHGRKGGIFDKPGFWGNLPCGEAFIAPVEGTADGVYFIDGSLPGIGRLSEPVSVSVQSGYAVEFRGGQAARWLEETLTSVGSPQAFNLAEFGIGCNHQAQVTGITLEDEKAMGTCHLALGNNAFFGGTVHCGIHLDGVLTQPDVWIDDKMILRGGEHLV